VRPGKIGKPVPGNGANPFPDTWRNSGRLFRGRPGLAAGRAGRGDRHLHLGILEDPGHEGAIVGQRPRRPGLPPLGMLGKPGPQFLQAARERALAVAAPHAERGDHR
ncbi:MAG: hypothetical protein ACK55I_20060, partial [bacterium]